VVQEPLGSQVTLDTPKGFTLHETGDGSWDLVNSSGERTTLTLDQEGLLTPESKATLDELGFQTSSETTPVVLSGETASVPFGEHGFVLPKEYSLQEISPGNWQLVDPKGETLTQFAANPDGTLPQASLDALQQQGVTVSTHTDIVTDV